MKKWIIPILAFLCPLTVWGVPVTPILQPHVTFVDAAGLPCAACSLYTYSAGTTTPLATYTDSTGTSMNTNPIVLDPAGAATIWLGKNSFKFILKSALGATIWTTDNVNSANLFPCSPANSVQIANSTLNGLSCDSSITIDTLSHSLNVGTLGLNYVTIKPLGTPTSWTLDTTSAATARTSLGTGQVGSGTIGQVATYAAAGTTVGGATALPNGITATTQTASDNSTKVATTAYVEAPGTIAPTSVALAGGTAMTSNQGNGALIQHSTGSVTSGNLAGFDVNGNVVDSGIAASANACTAFLSTVGAGCTIMADGKWMQWKAGTAIANNHAEPYSEVVSWPVAFPTSCYFFNVTTQIAALTTSSDEWFQTIGSCSTTTGTITLQETSSGGDGTLTTPMIIAIGK